MTAIYKSSFNCRDRVASKKSQNGIMRRGSSFTISSCADQHREFPSWRKHRKQTALSQCTLIPKAAKLSLLYLRNLGVIFFLCP